jgi:hypothetical protein
MPSDRVVAVSGQLILVSGIGSVLGPLIGASIMGRFDINGVLYFMAGAVLLLAGLGLAGSIISSAPAHLERPFGIMPPQPTPLAHESAGIPDDARPAAVFTEEQISL